MKNKLIKLLAIVLSVGTMMSMAVVTAFADDSVFGTAPAGVDTSKMTEMTGTVFWIVRAVIGAVGFIPGFIKLIQGFADENDRQRNGGIILLIITGIVIGATFVVEKWF
jgi:hypothetical protein